MPAAAHLAPAPTPAAPPAGPAGWPVSRPDRADPADRRLATT